ncbi:MAG: hypothetical protein JNJ54_19615 [Myxococcaceae bacterium]|nr:hypothetical protein [Myxococcaceae bacterium]
MSFGLARTMGLAAAVWGLGALAQNPDEDWQPLPNAPAPPTPGPTPPPPPPLPPLPPRGPLVAPGGMVTQPPIVTPQPVQAVRERLGPREQPNTVSMFGAPALGQWRRGQAFVLGFPLFQLRASIGLLENLDVGVGYDSFYLLMNEVRLLVKYGFGKGPGVSVALSFEGGGAFFSQRAAREQRSSRWLTGRRNFNFAPGVLLSYQAASLRAARLFIDVRYMLAVDTEPFAEVPLQGVPATFTLGHNVLTKVGAELPLSERTAFLFSLGLDVHLRPNDSPVMPTVAVGLITGF